MPARDLVHDALVNALEKDNWEITDDPLFIKVGRRKGYIDIGAEKFIAAIKGNKKIAVEGKGFSGSSELSEFEKALGQFNIYALALEEKEPDRILYLAVPEDFYRDFMEDSFFQKVVKRFDLKIIIFNVEKQIIISWID